MAKVISDAGSYNVTIRDPYWEDAERDGVPGMALVLPGYCEIGGEEHVATGRLYFKSTIIGGGKNAGRALWEVSAETCEQIGMTPPFSPEKREELNGAEAVFVVQLEKYKDKLQARVAFVNPPGKPHLEDAAAKKVWMAVKESAPPMNAPNAPEPPQGDNDGIPF